MGGQVELQNKKTGTREMIDIPGGSVVKNLPANAGDMSSIPGSERSPGGGNGNPLQYSCLGNPMDREAWLPTAQGSQRVGHHLTTKQQQYTTALQLFKRYRVK